MTTGEKIKYRRQELGLSVDELADKIGKNRATVYRYESDEIEKLPVSILGPLAKALNCSPSYFVDLGPESQDNYQTESSFYKYGILPIKTKKFPMLGKIACGEPKYCNEEYETFIEASANIDADFCLEAKGDSMINARIHNGDVVFIKKQPTVENGEIAAVIIDNEATLKRVYYYPDKNKLVLNAENPAYEPFVYTAEELNQIKILGKAVAFQSFVK